MPLDRDRVPDWPAYAEQQGMPLVGRGRWLTTHCDFHADTKPSMRVNTETGAWVCMACGAKGGDVLSHYLQLTGCDFVTAARALGAWRDGPRDAQAHRERPRRLSARDALEAIELELMVCAVVISDVMRGTTPNAQDWQRFMEATGRVSFIAQEART